ncbi:hypothetical protein J2S34_000644 [Nitrobacter winogradskyi]|uniref:Uncharacterized protein n=1 Tax=Nitrobacter winogradskyi TaxID=913 RepID=A0ACC6AG76_NITWI|nr:hypothetical protein [Nitrobacter winogradskyi]
MSRTPARITQADVSRALRAAKQAGAGYVEVMPDGTIRISFSPQSTVPTSKTPETQLERPPDVIL